MHRLLPPARRCECRERLARPSLARRRRAVEAKATGSARLRKIHSGVRSLDEYVGIVTIVWIDANSDARGQAQQLIADRDRGVECSDQLVSDLGDVVRVGHLI